MGRNRAFRVLPLLLVVVVGAALVAGLGARPAAAALCESNGSGNWSSAATWINCGGNYPGQTTNDYVRILDGHAVTLDITPGAVYFVEIQSGGTLTVSGSNTLKISSNGGTPGMANNGTFTAGSGIVEFNTDYGNTGSTVGGNIVFNGVTLSGVGVNFGSGSSVDGVLTINGGGWVNANPPTYGSSSILKYNSGGTYGRNLEWSATSGAGYPNHVQVSNNTALDLGNSDNGTARAMAGSLTVDAGSGFYMDYGANDMTAAVTVNGSVTLNGTMSLSELAGGDLIVKGSWTNNGTFNCRGRQVTFSGGGVQSIGGSAMTTFDFLLIDNLAAGEVALASNIAVLQELKINGSSAELSAGSATITMQGSVSAAPVWINNGTFNRGTGTVAFTGDNNQHARILGAAATTFNNVTITRNGGGSNNFGVDFYDHDTGSRGHIAGMLTLTQYTFVASEENGSSTGCAPSNCDGTPVYDAGSTLRYNNTGSFDSAAEWWPDDADPLCGTDKGLPYNVVVDNGTTMNVNAAFGNNGQAPNYGASSNKTTCGAITINSGSTLQATAGILSVKGNWTNNGTFTHNSGTVRFNGISTISGASVTSFFDIWIAAAGSLTGPNGKVKVAHNWTNDGTYNAGSGTVDFNGSTAQLIAGGATTTFTILEIANSSGGVSLGHYEQIVNHGVLSLTSGLLTLGPYNMLMDYGAYYAGTPNATRMVVADGSGSLCYTFGNGMHWIFVYPVGDNTNGANYSPLRLSFPGGAYTYGQACVRVTDAKHPDNPSTDHYLTRYWALTSSGITGYAARVIVWYVGGAEDVVGTESNICAMEWTNGAWIYGPLVDTVNHSYQMDDVLSFGDFTGGSVPTAVKLISFASRPAASGVLVTWETASEHDNAGFNLYRSVAPDGPGTQLNVTLIPSRSPGGDQGAAYDWLDTTAAPGVTYYYTLEDVDVHGVRTSHGPVTLTLWRAYLPLVKR